MAADSKIITLEAGEEEIYGRAIFAAHEPRSRVMKEVIEDIEKELSGWRKDDRGVLLECCGVRQHQGNYYLTSTRKDWQEKFSPRPGEKTYEIEQIMSWIEKLLEALSEVEIDYQKLLPLRVDHLRLTEEGEIILLPPRTADYLQLYSEDERPELAEECYRPPEMFRAEKGEVDGGEQHEKSLVFNLAVIFYYLLTGEAPYQGRDKSEILARIKNGRMLSAHLNRPEIGEVLSGILSRALSPDPEDRPGLQELQQELKVLGESDIKTSSQDIEISSIERRKRLFNFKQTLHYQLRRRWVILAIAAVLIIGLPLIFFTGGPEQFITSRDTPEEVAEHFYRAVNEKNVTRLDDTGTIDLGELRRMVTEAHVMESMQELYQMEDIEAEEEEEVPEEELEERLETLFGVEELNLELEDEEPVLVRAEYDFFFQTEEETLTWEASDELLLERIDDRWQIVAIRGFMERVIAGELHEYDDEIGGNNQ